MKLFRDMLLRTRRSLAASRPGQFQPYSHTLPDRYPWLFEFVTESLGKGSACQLLSFGCSRGDEVFTLRGYFPSANIKGIDISPRNIQVCRERARQQQMSGVSFGVAADTFTEPAQHYDAIFCLAVLCHGDLSTYGANHSDPLISFAQFSRIVAGFAYCLKPNGWLLLLTTNFRFCDTDTAQDFDVMLEADPEQLAPDVLFDKNNVLMPGERYHAVAFRKRGTGRSTSAKMGS
jgi:SAM-dependent methyltransferase